MRPSIVPLPATIFSLVRNVRVWLPIRPAFRCASHQSAPRLKFRESSAAVPVGNSGNVLLDILKPVAKRGESQSQSSGNVILFLPPGPLFGPATAPSDVPAKGTTLGKKIETPSTPQQVLASATRSTVVTVNFRLDRSPEDGSSPSVHKYPTPIHDTLAGFDWIFQHLKPRQLCVFGTHIGGSLAVMLALTEPRSVRALAATEPMCDWVGLDDYCQVPPDSEIGPAESAESGDGSHHTGKSDTPPTSNDTTATQNHRKRGRKKKQAPPDLVPLIDSRKKLFRKPDNYFDSFASPALFLRTPGKKCPKHFPSYLTGPEYPVPVLQRPINPAEEEEWYSNFVPEPDVDMLPEELEPPSSPTPQTVRRRKSLSRWPPYGLDYGLGSYGSRSDPPVSDKLALPPVRIFVHSNIHNQDDVTDSDTASTGDGPHVNGEIFQRETLPEAGWETGSESESESESASSSDETAKSRRAPRGSLADVAKSTRGETVLARQGAEMVSLMHNACFWGRPFGYGEQRVRIVRVPFPTGQDGTSSPSGSGGAVAQSSSYAGEKDPAMLTELEAGKWFCEVLEEEESEV